MRRSAILAVLAITASLSLAAACSAPTPTEARRNTSVRHDGDPADTTKKCGGMIGSGTVTC